MIEIWTPIAGFEGRYEVSNYGKVRSVGRLVSATRPNGSTAVRTLKSRVIKTHVWGAKYPGLVLLGVDGIRYRRMLHQVVAEAFVPNPNGFDQINHIDADRFNAKASNLEWCTGSMNIKHAHAIGSRKTGKEHHFAALPRDSKGRCMPSVGK